MIKDLLAVMALPLSQGLYVLVDGEDYEWLSQWKWSACKGRNTFYATRTNTIGTRKKILMHREVVRARLGEEVDHINRNGLDNRRANLRICSHSDNLHNSIVGREGTSQYRGVSWQKNAKKWQASIKQSGKDYWLGNYPTEELAAKAYNKKAKELYGDFARLNDV